MGAIYEVYLDVMAIQNLLSDVVSLAAVNLILQKRRSLLRILAFACFGTVLNCFLFVSVSWGWYLFCVHCLIHPAVLLLLFREKHIVEFAKEYVFSYLCNFLLGGIRQVFFMNLGRVAGYEAAGVFGIVLFVLGILWCRQMLRERLRYRKACLYFNGKMAEVRVLNDSGNLLHDVYSGKMVSLVGRELFMQKFQDIPPTRLVPYTSLGCEDGLLEVLSIDGMKIFGNQEIFIEKPVVGLADGKLFDGKPYQMIVNVQELENEKFGG